MALAVDHMVVTSLNKGKCHPTLEDGVIVGSGAQVLGPITIGAGARIGANAVVLTDVPPGETMVGVPAHAASSRARKEFVAYGCDAALPDPVEGLIYGLRQEVAALSARLHELEARERSEEHTSELQSH